MHFNLSSPLYYYLVLRGKTPYLRKSIKKRFSWYGSKHGGFYIIPELLNERSVVYSFGIGEDISFDRELISKHGCSVYGFDPTPKSINWLKSQEVSAKFHFLPYGISNKTGNTTFFLPNNENHVSGSLTENKNVNATRRIEVPVKSFKDIVKELGHEKIDVLKMDIEGAEYDVIPDILKQEVEIRQILIEVHHRLLKNGNNKTKALVSLLKKNGYLLFAFSETGEELSFVKRS